MTNITVVSCSNCHTSLGKWAYTASPQLLTTASLTHPTAVYVLTCMLWLSEKPNKIKLNFLLYTVVLRIVVNNGFVCVWCKLYIFLPLEASKHYILAKLCAWCCSKHGKNDGWDWVMLPKVRMAEVSIEQLLLFIIKFYNWFPIKILYFCYDCKSPQNARCGWGT